MLADSDFATDSSARRARLAPLDPVLLPLVIGLVLHDGHCAVATALCTTMTVSARRVVTSHNRDDSRSPALRTAPRTTFPLLVDRYSFMSFEYSSMSFEAHDMGLKLPVLIGIP